MLDPPKVSLGTLLALFVACLVGAQDIPVIDWEVPRGDLAKNAVVPPNPFAAISPPCRLSDSRVTSGGPGPIPGSGTRNYDFIPGGSPACGALPANVVALSLYFTVVGPLGPGFLFAYPTGSPPGSPTSIINYGPGELRNNAAVVPVNPSTGSFTVGTGVSGTDLIIDINGVFYNTLDPSHQLSIVASLPGGAAISGLNTSTGAGMTIGVRGLTSGVSFEDAGIEGRDGTGTVGLPTTLGSSGVRGLSEDGTGVKGVTDGPGIGVAGMKLNSFGTLNSAGYLGYTMTTGILSVGDTAVINGSKFFIEPHPTDASKVIRYISLEGNEPGTYFRGKGRFDRGLARIPVPEDFRIVTDPEGLSVQVTPIGEMASVAVTRIGLDEIIVKASRNVEFFYLVNGVRKAHKGVPVVAENEKYFVPEGPDAILPARMTSEEKARLIANGTYNADGTVNLETAKRLGWDKGWKTTAAAPAQ